MSTEVDVRYLKITKDPSWSLGDVVKIQVPFPGGQNEWSKANSETYQSDDQSHPITVADIPAQELRQIFIEVPDSCNKFFYIKYLEDSVITQYTHEEAPNLANGEQLPLKSPVVVPQCSIVKQTHLGFFHWHLIYECFIPLAVYIGSISLLLYCIPRPQAVWITYLVGGLPLAIVGTGMIYWRYKKSVMISEMIWHLVLSGCGMFVIGFVNKYLGIALRAVLKYIFPSVEWLQHRAGPVLIAPITEEIYKYAIFRFIANRAVVLDVQGLLAYSMLAGMMFGIEENVFYFRRAENGYAKMADVAEMNRIQYLEIKYYARIGMLIFHVYLAALSAARFAQRRFLGKDWGMWRCIWISMLMHALNNGVTSYLGVIVGLIMHIMGMDASLSYSGIIASLLLVVVGLVILRVNIVKTQCIPTVDIHALVASGQIKPRGISTIVSDMCCLCSRKRKGLFTKQRKDRRSIIYSNDLE